MNNSISSLRLNQPLKCLLSVLIIASSQAGYSQERTLDDWDDRFGPPGVYGSVLGTGGVNAIAVYEDYLYAGGNEFITPGNEPIKTIARWNSSTKKWSELGIGVSGTVHAFARSGNTVYIGGEYFDVTTINSYGIAQWNMESRTWTTMGGGVDRSVYAIAVSGDEVYVAGLFKRAGDVPANNIAKWDGRAWSALGRGVNGTVYALAVKDKELFVAGSFDSVGTIQATNIAKWDGKKWSKVGSGVDGSVRALAIQGNGLYAGGGFTTAGRIPAFGIARWNGTTWNALGQGVSSVYAIAINEHGHVYAGGFFKVAGGLPAANIAKWDGKNWAPLDAGIKGSVRSLSLNGQELYVGGRFSQAGKIIATNLAKWNAAENSWSAILNGKNNGVSGYLSAFTVYGNELYAGGNFYGAGTLPVKSIAKWNGTRWRAVGEGINGRIEAIGVDKDGVIYVAGSFSMAGKDSANNIAKWDGRAWHSIGDGVNGVVHSLAVSGNEIYVAGIFKAAGATFSHYFRKWDGRQWDYFGVGLPLAFSFQTINSIAILNNQIFVGNDTDNRQYPGTPQANLGKWDGARWINIEIDGPVTAIVVHAENLYVAGKFEKIGAAQANGIAKWDGRQWAAIGTHLPWEISALTAYGNELYVTGNLRGLNENVAKWNGQRWIELGSLLLPHDEPPPEYNRGIVKALTVLDNKLYAGGIFHFVGKQGRTQLASNFTAWHGVVNPMNEPPTIAPLPELRFNEDRPFFHLIRHWYPFVTDADDADSTLKFTMLSGKQVKTTRHPRGYSFTAPANWFGRDTLQVIVADRSQLADTAALMITVDPTNDKPKWTGLPDSLSFKTGAAAQLKMWDLVEDIETPDSLLLYRFAASKPGLRWKFHRATGTLVLTAPQFHGRARLFVKVGDGKAAAYDTIAVHVEMPKETLAAVAKQNSSELIPTAFVLQQNYPNPFNPTTLIRFGLPQDAEVKLDVFNLNGQLVATLVHGRQAAGYHDVLFDAGHLPSGNYFTVLRAGETKLVRRIVLMK